MEVGWGLGKLTSATYLINIGTREQLLVGEFFSRHRLRMTLGGCLMLVNHSYYTFLLLSCKPDYSPDFRSPGSWLGIIS